MFCAVNGTLRRQRRRLVMLAVVLGLAGAVVITHGVMNHDHVDDAADALVVCLAVAPTAAAAVAVALAWAVRISRPLPIIPLPPSPEPVFATSAIGNEARAGPPRLQVFRQ